MSNSLSSFTVAPNGSLTLLAGVAAGASGPNDLANVGDRGASFLYVLNSGSGTVEAFQVSLQNGSLTALPAVGGLPVNDGAQGLAAY